jgi:hypothetical protein
MSSSKPFLKCYKCSNACRGRYKDNDGNPLCMTCKPKDQYVRTLPCVLCGGGQINIKGDNICSRCRFNQKHPSEVRRCPTCHKTMRTELSTLTECMECTGIAKYNRILRTERRSNNN